MEQGWTQETDMSISPKEWIEIDRRIHGDTPWAKTKSSIKNWSGVGAIVAVILFGLKGCMDSAEFKGRTDERLKASEKQLERTEASIGRIDGKLQELDKKLLSLLVRQSPAQALKEISELPKSEFIKNIPVVQAALRETSEEAPQYWQTVLRFIQSATSELAHNAPSYIAPPPGTPNFVVQSGTLDGAGHSVKGAIVLLKGGGVKATHFMNCRIIFTENPVQMSDITFTDCAFEFPLTKTPNQYLKRSAQSILASNLQSVSITTG